MTYYFAQVLRDTQKFGTVISPGLIFNQGFTNLVDRDVFTSALTLAGFKVMRRWQEEAA